MFFSLSYHNKFKGTVRLQYTRRECVALLFKKSVIETEKKQTKEAVVGRMAYRKESNVK